MIRAGSLSNRSIIKKKNELDLTLYPSTTVQLYDQYRKFLKEIFLWEWDGIDLQRKSNSVG